MLLNSETLRFIFGLKLRNLRLERGQSLKDLAKSSGLSPSYINEIEKGKKYPKSDKILLLANSLGVKYDDLISVQLSDELNSIAKILEGDLLKNIPFEVFGLPAQHLFELVAESPDEFSALIGAVLELTRLYDVRVEDFFYAALKAYLDRHQNWIESLEEQSFKYRQEKSVPPIEEPTELYERLLGLLKNEHNVDIVETDFEKASPDGKHLHFVCEKKGRTIFNASLPLSEKVFLAAREIGFQTLKLKDRAQTSDLSAIDSFDRVFNNFQASYFASSFLIPKEDFESQVRDFFANNQWQGDQFRELIERYPGTPETVFHRLSQILPAVFGIDRLFFLKMVYDPREKAYSLIREFHLSSLHSPHSVKADYHYCRRWITTHLIQKQKKSSKPSLYGTQVSNFWGTERRYFCLSAAYDSPVNDKKGVGITLGIELDSRSEKFIRFCNDPAIENKTVSSTCEQCNLADCKDRVAAPLPPRREQNTEITLQQIIAQASQVELAKG